MPIHIDRNVRNPFLAARTRTSYHFDKLPDWEYIYLLGAAASAKEKADLLIETRSDIEPIFVASLLGCRPNIQHRLAAPKYQTGTVRSCQRAQFNIILRSLRSTFTKHSER